MSKRHSKRIRLVIVLALLICSLVLIISTRNFRSEPDLLIDKNHELKYGAASSASILLEKLKAGHKLDGDNNKDKGEISEVEGLVDAVEQELPQEVKPPGVADDPKSDQKDNQDNQDNEDNEDNDMLDKAKEVAGESGKGDDSKKHKKPDKGKTKKPKNKSHLGHKAGTVEEDNNNNSNNIKQPETEEETINNEEETINNEETKENKVKPSLGKPSVHIIPENKENDESDPQLWNDEEDDDLGPAPPPRPQKIDLSAFPVPLPEPNPPNLLMPVSTEIFGSLKYGSEGVPPEIPPWEIIDEPPVKIKSKTFPKIADNFKKIKIKPLDFRIYSHNIKNGGHVELTAGEEPWIKRLPKIVNSIKFNCKPNTIITLQEAYKFQILDIMDELNKYSPKSKPEWSYYGKGRIDGGDMGEMVPVIYRNAEWELVFDDTVWLNEFDERTALAGWDAKYIRVLSYVILKHKATKNYINVFNTHLDHIGVLSRLASIEKIIKKAETLNQWPSFLCGDLNSEPEGQIYRLLTENWVDSGRQISPENRYGHEKSTVTGFIDDILELGGQNIDYIFAPYYTVNLDDKVSCKKVPKSSSNAKDKILLQLKAFGLLHSRFDGLYMSDHRPLAADYYLGPKCY